MDDLALALLLADRADEITLGRFGRADLEVRAKPDRSPVTEADLETERALRALIGEHRPGDGILGEEFEETPGQRGRRWILDPIDHTDNYTRAVEVCASGRRSWPSQGR